MKLDKWTVRDMQEAAHSASKEKGWWPESDLERASDGDVELIATKLMLITTEVAEAMEDVRNGHIEPDTRLDGKPEGLPSELADIVIRVMDLAGSISIDLAHEIHRKMEYNATRSHRHGGKKA